MLTYRGMHLEQGLSQIFCEKLTTFNIVFLGTCHEQILNA